MLSMGFAKELHAIADKLPKERQGLFFSATIPPDIERLAQSQLKEPEFITLSSDQIGALEINHYVYVLRGGDKRQELIRILEVEDPESAIVFCNTKDETERLADALTRAGYDAGWLNGDLEQRERERVMQATREGKLRFLVATDVAARGIDISHLTHVINADFPETAEAYVHRTGRTGRAGKTGTAISLVTPKDIGNLYILRLTYKIRPIERQVVTAGELKTRGEADLVGMFVEAFAGRAVDPGDLALARRLLTHPDAEKIVAALVRDHLGAKAAAEGDVVAEAAAARRGRNPPPVVASVAGSMPSVASAASAPPNVRTAAPEPPHSPRTHRASAPSADERKARPPRDRAPIRAYDARPAPPLGEPARPERPRGERRGIPHKSYATWEPPTDPDDDKPILPGITVSDMPEPGVFRGTEPARRAETTRGEHDEGPPSDRDDPDFAQIFINVGRRDGARPADFQKVLAEAAGLAPADTGRIRIRDRNTFVSVRKDSLDRVVAALGGQVIAGRSVLAEPAKQRIS
jgi:ATP-dependent RNA helicase DeaD